MRQIGPEVVGLQCPQSPDGRTEGKGWIKGKTDAKSELSIYQITQEYLFNKVRSVNGVDKIKRLKGYVKDSP